MSLARRMGPGVAMGARPIQLHAPQRAELAAWPVVRRRLVVAAALAAALAAAYLLWFRDSSLVEVRDVTVEGAETDASAAQS